MSQPKDFGFNEDISMLKETFAKFLTEKQPINMLRPSLEGTEDPYHGATRVGFFDKDTWQQMIQLGWHAVAVPEEQGGIGMGLVAATALAEEIGRFALPTPLSTTLQACFLLRELKSAGADQLLSQIATGESVGLAIYGQQGSLNTDSTDVMYEAGTLTGTSWYVTDAQKLDHFIVAANSENGIGLFKVSANQPGITLEPDRIVDLTRDQACLVFSGAQAETLCDPGHGEPSLKAALPALLTLIAADIAGAAEWQLQTTADYAKVRQQFDRPIGFFQAVKHPIVDMMIQTDATRSLVYNAACAFDFDKDDAPRCAHLAKSSASDTASLASQCSTQLHGGIGFTWEADIQVYHKRQIHSEFMFGDGTWQRSKLAELI
jgi:alkylation response protein AidB-like acyl-CoA dehydrogenase